MNKTCVICEGDGKYKCPTCLIFYCSVTCCIKHRAGKCDVAKTDEQKDNKDKEKEDEEEIMPVVKKRKIDTKEDEAVVPTEKLELLKSNEDVNRLLTNSHLRSMLKVIDEAEDSEAIMDKAMHEPIFVEFADACLKVVDPPSDEET